MIVNTDFDFHDLPFVTDVDFRNSRHLKPKKTSDLFQTYFLSFIFDKKQNIYATNYS